MHIAHLDCLSTSNMCGSLINDIPTRQMPMFLSFSETSKLILGQLITTKSRIRLQKIYWNQLICMTLTIRTGWTYFKHLQVQVDQLIHQPNFIIIVIIWWDFVTGIFPPYSLLTNSHHGGFLSWWEFAGRPSSSSQILLEEQAYCSLSNRPDLERL